MMDIVLVLGSSLVILTLLYGGFVAGRSVGRAEAERANVKKIIENAEMGVKARARHMAGCSCEDCRRRDYEQESE